MSKNNIKIYSMGDTFLDSILNQFSKEELKIILKYNKLIEDKLKLNDENEKYKA